MLPDVARYAVKVQRKFPIIVQRAGWAILLIFVLMYAAIGLNGILIFIGGIIVVIIVQLALLFRYIVNENKRAALAREGQEKYLLETELEDYVLIEDPNQKSQVDQDHTSEHKESPKEDRRPSFNRGMTTSILLNQSEQQKHERISLLVTDVEETKSTDRRTSFTASRYRANSDEIIEGSPRARRLSNPNIGEISQDQPPTINILESNDRDAFPQLSPLLDKSTHPSNRKNQVERVEIQRTRRFERPPFLSECFEEPEPLFFYMYQDCQCIQRRNVQIHGAFMAKQRGVTDALKGVAHFYELLSTFKMDSGKQLQKIGDPPSSFLSSYKTSILFDSEQSLFKVNIPDVLFCEIRGKQQNFGQTLFGRASDWLQEAQVGNLTQLGRRIEEIGEVFDEKFKEMSTRVEEKAQELHQREGIYRDTEDKLMQMIAEYQELIQYDEASKRLLLEQQQVVDFTEKISTSPVNHDVTKRRTYSEMVHLESQCKISHYELNNQSLELKDSYIQMIEAIEDQERFKVEMVEQLQELCVLQAGGILSMIKELSGDVQSMEVEALTQYTSLKDLQGIDTADRADQPIDIDDVDEVNLSEYDGDDNVQINQMDRYSDLRGSHGSHSHSRSLSQRGSQSKSPGKLGDLRERGNSFDVSPLLKLNQQPSHSRNKSDTKWSKSKTMESPYQTRGSIQEGSNYKVTEPFNDTPEALSETPEKEAQEFKFGHLELRSEKEDGSNSFVEIGDVQEVFQTSEVKQEGLLKKEEEETKGNGENNSLLNISLNKSVSQNSKKDKDEGQEQNVQNKISVAPLQPPSTDEYIKAKEQVDQDHNYFNQMNKAIDELAQYFTDLSELNNNESNQMKNAISTQFKEVKQVLTGGNLTLEELENLANDQESIRQSIAASSSAALQRTDSKKFGESEFVLIFESDFNDLATFWEEQMEEFKHTADQSEIAADLLRAEAEDIKVYRDTMKAALQDKFQTAVELGESASKVQAEIDQIIKSLQSIEEKNKQAELEKLETTRLETLESQKDQPEDINDRDDQEPKTPQLGHHLSRVSSGNPQIMSEDLDTNIEVKVMPDKKIMHQQLNKSVNIKLSSLLRPWEEKPKHKSGSVKSNRETTLSAADKEISDKDIQSLNKRSQSHDDMQKIKGLSKSEQKNSSAAISFANMKPIIFDEFNEEIKQEEEPLKTSKTQIAIGTGEEVKVNPYTALANDDLNKEESKTPPAGSSIGYFFSIIASAFVSEQKQSKEELEERLGTQQTELTRLMENYLKHSKTLIKEYTQTNKETQKRMSQWKASLLTVTVEKSKKTLKYSAENASNLQLTKADLDKNMIKIKVKNFMHRHDNTHVSYHEPHCRNYKLFRAQEEDNPFLIKIQNLEMGSTVDFVDIDIERQNNFPSYNIDDDKSCASAKDFDVRSTTTSNVQFLNRTLTPVNTNDREQCEWVNDLLAVFWEAWTDAKVFHDLVLENIYNVANLDRPSSLGEIKFKSMELIGKPPKILWVKNVAIPNPATDSPCFTIEGDATVPGKVKMLVETAYKINWPAYNWTSINVELMVVVSRIRGRIRFQYSNDKEHYGGSYLQFLGKPAVSVDVEPLLFKKSKINLKSIPTVKNLIKDLISEVIENLCFPNRVEMDVPCVLETIEVDKAGRPVIPKPQGK